MKTDIRKFSGLFKKAESMAKEKRGTFFFSHTQFIANCLLDVEENTPNDNLGEYVRRLMFVACMDNFASGLIGCFGKNIGRFWCFTTNQIIIREK